MGTPKLFTSLISHIAWVSLELNLFAHFFLLFPTLLQSDALDSLSKLCKQGPIVWKLLLIWFRRNLLTLSQILEILGFLWLFRKFSWKEIDHWIFATNTSILHEILSNPGAFLSRWNFDGCLSFEMSKQGRFVINLQKTFSLGINWKIGSTLKD